MNICSTNREWKKNGKLRCVEQLSNIFHSNYRKMKRASRVAAATVDSQRSGHTDGDGGRTSKSVEIMTILLFPVE